MTGTAILTLMNVLRLRRASLHSCQDLRPRLTSAMEEEEEEEEAKADTEQMLSTIFWRSYFGLSRSSCLLLRQSHAEEQSRQLPGQKSFFRPWSEASQGRAGGMRDLCQCQATCLPDTLGAAALAADMCGRVVGVAQHPPFAVNKPTPCLQTKAPKRV